MVLDDVSCTIEPGEIVAILGPSGCGKSTLLRIAAGLIRPTRGAVAIDGAPVLRPGRSVGMVFQEDALLEWRTVLQNVLLPAQIRGMSGPAMEQRACGLLETVGLLRFRGVRPSQLSGGMKQRAALCQAMLCEPRLLLMDEPFGALDALTRKQMQYELQQLWSRLSNTVVLVTHSIEEAVLLADRVIVFSPRPGRFVQELRSRLPRPRTADAERMQAFGESVQAIEHLFEELGVLSQHEPSGAQQQL